MKTSKKTIRNIIIIFLAVMALLTFFSSTINNMGVNMVETYTVTSGTLNWRLSADGFIVGAEYINIFPEQQLKIKEIHVKEGGTAKKGDILISFDVSDLEERIKERRRQYQSNEIQIKRLGIKPEELPEELETGFEKIKSEREDALREIERKYESMLRQHEYDLSVMEDKYSAIKILYDAGGETLENLTSAENGIRQLQKQWEQRLAEKETEIKNTLKEYQAREEALAESIKAKEAAENQKEAAEKQAELDIQSLALQQRAILDEIDRLNEVVESSRAVYAPGDIYIEKIYVEKGMLAPMGVSMIKAFEQSKGVYASFEVENDELKHVFTDMKVTLKSGVTANLKTDGIIEVIRKPVNGGNSIREVLVRGDFTGFETGDRVTMDLSRTSAQYEYVVPLDAVQGSGIGAFVYVVKERTASLGKEYYLQKAKILVEETDDSMAAVSGGLMWNEEIAVASSRPMFAGEKVRVADKAN